MDWKISHTVYGLELQDISRIHNVLHVTCLKRVLGQHQKAQTMLPMLDDEG